ncbi:MAG TPA: hypothetical protein VFQ92_17420 [Blastocatellia bacterium]|nr:hypothetical protein [Blastocatellia bacterium]
MGRRLIKKTIEITVERSRVIRVSRPHIQIMARCPKCLAETRMISPQEASALTGLSLREIYQRVEAGSLHFIETQQGQLYICTNSIDI